eukprot:CAMPEP_0118650448 /NCGR_PEP_ID=MMETSP0785-20121206/10255_1 /TAXON_ID=91992 /ORGANISM="Bolidomonas pacifica, Strain CCMP 1866" /LENGTH=280 /DNA_ID=CAMNT_0006542829 /DNA_START=170 /DNA_END=1008 /DNA_ORIENTATION=-
MSSPRKPLFPLIPTVLATASPVTLASWVKLTSSLDGRDKVTKIIAYLSRLLSWYYLSVLNLPSTASKFQSLKNTIQMSRKSFRFGKTLNEVHKIRNCLKRPTLEEVERVGDETKESPQQSNALPLYRKVLMIGKMIGLAGFWTGDNLYFLTKGAGFIHHDDDAKRGRLAKRAQETASRFYFAGAICQLFENLENVRRHWKALEKAQIDYVDDTDLKKLQLKGFEIYVSLFKACCDTVVFSNIAGVDIWKKRRGKKLNEAVVSLAGLGSASTVIWKNWPKV